MPKVARRQIVVDKTFQLQFLRIWLLVGLSMVVLSAACYFFIRKVSGMQRIDPFVLKVLLGMSVFIILFCLLMGTMSILLAHRVAGAAYRIEKSLDRMIEGGLDEEVTLRKGDYLTRIADRLNVLQERLRTRRADMESVVRDLTDLRNRAPGADHPAIDKLIEKAKAGSGV